MDHARTGGTLLNQRFLPQVLEDDTGLTQLLHLCTGPLAIILSFPGQQVLVGCLVTGSFE